MPLLTVTNQPAGACTAKYAARVVLASEALFSEPGQEFLGFGKPNSQVGGKVFGPNWGLVLLLVDEP